MLDGTGRVEALIQCRLNAAENPNEMLTFSTHMVHPAVIAAGERWTSTGCLRKLVIQGESNASYNTKLSSDYVSSSPC
jgi:hypothetical protein